MPRQLCSNRAAGFVPHRAITGSSFPVEEYSFYEEKNAIDSLTLRNFNLLKATFNDNAKQDGFSWSFSGRAIPHLLSLLSKSLSGVKTLFLSDGRDSDGSNSEKSNEQSMVQKRKIVGRGAKYYQIYGKTHATPNDFLNIVQHFNALNNGYKLSQRKERPFQGCSFCKNLGKINYSGHFLENGQDGDVTCPVLRAYICPICRNANPDEAHAIRHCPGRNAPIRPSNALPRHYVPADDATLNRF